MIGWNLFVPNESDWSDERALEAAAKLARTDDYRLEREGLRDWWRSNVGAGMPPELAVLELNRRADRLNKVASAGKTRTRALRSLALLGGGTAIGGVWFPPVAIAGGLLALVSVGADWVLGYTPAPAGLAPAAMIRNARGALAWYGKAS